MYHIPTPEARSCFEKARGLSKIKQFDEALYFLDEALKLNPNDIDILNKKEEILDKLGKTKILTL